MPALSRENRLMLGVLVCDAVCWELLFGMAEGGFPSYPLSCVRRVCSKCYRMCSSNVVPGRLSHDATRRLIESSDSVER